jgi:hypothetical protein
MVNDARSVNNAIKKTPEPPFVRASTGPMKKLFDDLPPGAPQLISVRKFRETLGVDSSTVWRYRQRGWLPEPIYLGSRPYLAVQAVREFERRAAAGEFAMPTTPPTPPSRRI